MYWMMNFLTLLMSFFYHKMHGLHMLMLDNVCYAVLCFVVRPMTQWLALKMMNSWRLKLISLFLKMESVCTDFYYVASCSAFKAICVISVTHLITCSYSNSDSCFQIIVILKNILIVFTLTWTGCCQKFNSELVWAIHRYLLTLALSMV